MSEQKTIKTSDNFETKIGKLKELVNKLENDPGVTLEDSLALYEDGLRLTRECVDELGAMQTRIDDLNKQLDDILSRPVNGDNND